MIRENGYIDGIRGSTIEGWAQSCVDNTNVAIVEILIDGDLIGAVSATTYREDLARRSICGGFAGFSYLIPARYFDGARHRLDCRISHCQSALGDSPLFFARKMETMPGKFALDRQVFTKDFDHSRFRRSLAATRKLAIVSTYHNLPEFLKYQNNILRSLQKSGYTSIVVHACDVYSSRLKLADDHAFLVVKRNIGYDFGSYALGMSLAKKHLGELDELVLTNDSVFHMGDDLTDLICRARSLGVDLVGATDSFERRYHLQSYFLWAGANLVSSPVLTNFLMSFPTNANREVAVEEGELALTHHILNEGLSAAAICTYEAVAAAWMRRRDQNWAHLRRLTERSGAGARASSVLDQFENTVELIRSGVPVNPTHFFWDSLLKEFNLPFLKREFVLSNPCKISTYLNLPNVLEDYPRVKTEIMEIVRRYGGERILALGDSGSERTARPSNIEAIKAHLQKSALLAKRA